MLLVIAVGTNSTIATAEVTMMYSIIAWPEQAFLGGRNMVVSASVGRNIEHDQGAGFFCLERGIEHLRAFIGRQQNRLAILFQCLTLPAARAQLGVNRACARVDRAARH